MKLSVTIENFDAIKNAFKKAPDIVNAEIDEALAKSIFKVQREIRMRTPVQTGRLRTSIGGNYGFLEIDKSKKIGLLGTNVNYAWAVEVKPMRHKTGEAGYFSKGVRASEDAIKKFFEEVITNSNRKIVQMTK